MQKLLLIFFSIYLSIPVSGQELNCKVQVINAKGTINNPQFMQTLQKSIYDFLNNRKWTNDNYAQQERIDCSMLINISDEISSGKYTAQLTIQSSRPIFNASYNTTLLNWVDKDFQFDYTEYQTLEFNDNSFQSNLSSLLAYYAYLVIGLDYDSFTQNGGNPYFLKAQNVVNQAQSAQEPGWKAFQSTRNRYWMVNNLLDSKMANLRTALYKYHRQGLDKMYDDPDVARKSITDCVNLLNGIYEETPSIMILQVFLAAKSDELVNIYSKANPNEKSGIVQTLSRIDASNAAKYAQILRSN
ncbi:MAG: DUF4835 family protein [Chitinophagales bacterium]|nr:DUF4835 family protein [Chitinophagales bacterium]